MYKFVKGSRLFMQGKRENGDYDNVADTFSPTSTSGGGHGSGHERHLATLDSSQDDIHAVHTMRSMAVNGSTEWEKSSKTVRSGGIKTRSTRTVRKVTTITRASSPSRPSRSCVTIPTSDRNTPPYRMTRRASSFASSKRLLGFLNLFVS